MGKKRILVVLDGLADLSCKELSGKTPLEAAVTPNLDKLALSSRLGYMYTIKEGIAPESDSATLAILGNDPFKLYTGRGPLEAAGTALKLGKNFTAFRANFATVSGNKVIDRRVGRGLTTKEARALSKAINENVILPFDFAFLPTIQHRGILVIYSRLSTSISNVDPAYVKKGKLGIAIDSDLLELCKPLDNSKESRFSSQIVNSFILQASRVLENHEVNKSRISKNKLSANYLLLRDAGNELPRLRKNKGRWLAIAGMPLEVGLARLAGMKTVDFSLPEFNKGEIYENVYATLKKTLDVARSSLSKYWDKYDSFYIHIKETDIPGHDGNAREKKKIIEYIDENFFSYLAKLNNSIICITADHSTPCRLKRHSSDPVPVLLYGKGSDKVKKFSEKSARHGSLGKLYGKNVVKLLY